MMHKAWCSIEEVPFYFSGSSIKFQGHTGWKKRQFESNLNKITRPVAAFKSLRFALQSLQSTVWYKTKFGSQNFGYQHWGLFANLCNVSEYVQCGSNNNVTRYCGWGIPEQPRYELWKIWRATNFVSFSRKLTCKAGTNCFKYECQRGHWSAPQHWMQHFTRHSVLNVITIGWSHFQSASNKPLKFVYFGRVSYFNW